MTGGNVFDGSLSALAPFGRLVAYGMAGRAAAEAGPGRASLMQKSRAVIGFWLAHCMARPQMMDAAMNELLPMVAEGALKPVVGGRYPLSAVREAHQDLLARRSTGKLVLDPAADASVPKAGQTRRLVQSRLRTAPISASRTPPRTNHGLMSLRLGRVPDLAAEVGVDLLELGGAGRLAVAAAGLVGDLLERRPVDRHRARSRRRGRGCRSRCRRRSSRPGRRRRCAASMAWVSSRPTVL